MGEIHRLRVLTPPAGGALIGRVGNPLIRVGFPDLRMTALMKFKMVRGAEAVDLTHPCERLELRRIADLRPCVNIDALTRSGITIEPSGTEAFPEEGDPTALRWGAVDQVLDRTVPA